MDTGIIFEKLMHLAVNNGLTVRFAPLKASYGKIKGDRLALRQDMTIEDINYNLAHELAHAFLHYDKGNTIASEKHEEYEEQADRTAKLLLCALGADMKLTA